MSSTSFSCAGQKQEFPEQLKALPPCQYVYFYVMVVKPVPLIICRLRFPREESVPAVIFVPKRYPLNDSASYLQYSKILAIFPSLSIQFLKAHSAPRFQGPHYAMADSRALKHVPDTRPILKPMKDCPLATSPGDLKDVLDRRHDIPSEIT